MKKSLGSFFIFIIIPVTLSGAEPKVASTPPELAPRITLLSSPPAPSPLPQAAAIALKPSEKKETKELSETKENAELCMLQKIVAASPLNIAPTEWGTLPQDVVQDRSNCGQTADIMFKLYTGHDICFADYAPTLACRKKIPSLNENEFNDTIAAFMAHDAAGYRQPLAQKLFQHSTTPDHLLFYIIKQGKGKRFHVSIIIKKNNLKEEHDEFMILHSFCASYTIANWLNMDAPSLSPWLGPDHQIFHKGTFTKYQDFKKLNAQTIRTFIEECLSINNPKKDTCFIKMVKLVNPVPFMQIGIPLPVLTIMPSAEIDNRAKICLSKIKVAASPADPPSKKRPRDEAAAAAPAEE